MVSKAEFASSSIRTSRSPRIRLSQSIIAGLTAILDACALAAGGWLIYLLYVAPVYPDLSAKYGVAVGLMTLANLQALYLAGLYRFGRLIHPLSQLGRINATPTLVFLAVLGCAFALKISDQYSRVWFFSWWLYSCGSLVLVRFAVAALLRRLSAAGYIGRNIVIYGASEQARALIRHIEGVNEPWNRIVGVFDDRIERSDPEVLGYPVLGDLRELLQWSRIHRADEVLIALPWSAEARLLELIRVLSVMPASVRLAPEFVGTDLLHRRTSFQYGVPMVSVLDKPVSGWSALAKQLLDIVLGGIFLIIALPVMAVIAVLIKLESRGPVLFKQQRYGFNHELIGVYKFRSMYVEQTDHNADRLARPGDPRITPLGAVLRRLSLDELPQLFNVMKGEMSVVGPRPHALQAKAGDKLYEDVIDEYAVRHKVKPGITGWAQVNGWRGATDTEADLLGRLEHDLYYIENWSIMFDLMIIARTFFAVVGGKNSH
jgi:Undecaprenyl-phosphate glucose phosphotransferase